MDPNNLNPLKEEATGSGPSPSNGLPPPLPSPPPRPMEGLHDQGPPSFLTKTYDVVDDPDTDRIVSWSRTNNSFVVWDPYAFSITLLPKYFKHNNFSSFVRQLNTYLPSKWTKIEVEAFNPREALKSTKKVDPDRWEFANEGFLRGQKHLLKTIKRRRPPSQPPPQYQSLTPYLEVGQFGLDGEFERLKRDKNILMAELVKLKQEQQNTRAHLKAMEERLQGTEQRQQQMTAFLARAMRNPNFLQQLAQQKDKRRDLEEAISKKRRRPIEHRPHCNVGTSRAQIKTEAQEVSELYGYGAPELENLALEMQGFLNEEHKDHQEEMGVELNDEFWEELLNEGIVEERGRTDLEERGSEDVNLLSEKLGNLSSFLLEEMVT